MKHFTVYNAEIFFVTSYNPMAWVVKRTKAQFKNMCIVGHPNLQVWPLCKVPLLDETASGY